MQKIKYTPELLAPAGSPEALRAAIEGGADAVYMGGVSFNARINAKNFTEAEQKEAIALAHAYGVKVYIAANTLIYDREREDYLRAAEAAYLAGADALIVADLGMARELRRRIPIAIHGSTQLSGHNVAAAELLCKIGFSRMVCAREMSREDIAQFCKDSPIEAEVFVHGALCVSTSGQCLFSSIVGGRSGNRGECAQPCRLPYVIGGRQSYPLSLCDLCLAEHIVELCQMKAASFKIEGRMKSPEYVRDVTRIWRRLLDEGRDASKEDMSELAQIFSRGGFTDGYYTKTIGRSMLGVRSEADKAASAAIKPFDKINRKIPIELKAKIVADSPAELTIISNGTWVTVHGQTPMRAINAPLSRETVLRNLSKLGGTPYETSSIELLLEEGLMLPISALNALRREAIEALQQAQEPMRAETDLEKKPLLACEHRHTSLRSAMFYNAEQIPNEAVDYFHIRYVPLEDFHRCGGKANGVMLPETVFHSQQQEVARLLHDAVTAGVEHLLICNLGQLDLVQKYVPRLHLHGDFRLNICNSSTAHELEALGFEDFVLSPELSLAQMRDIGGCGRAVVYGRLPLMLTEKCVGKELGGCESCKDGKTELHDRRGVTFPVRKRFGHRSVIFNSVPVYMADKKAELAKHRLYNEHFIFTVEGKARVADIIDAYKKEKNAVGGIKRVR